MPYVLQVQQAAKRAVALLNNTIAPDSAFDAALLTASLPAAGFDCWWRVSIAADEKESALVGDLPHWRCAHLLCVLCL